MKIFVYMPGHLDGKTMLEVEGSDTIRSVKEKIHDRDGVPLNLQRLIFDGRQPEDSRTLADCGVQEGSRIQLLLRLLSCKNCPGHHPHKNED